MSCASSWSTFQSLSPSRLGELELAPDAERFVARLLAVAVDTRRQEALLDHRLRRERAGELVPVDGPVVAVEHRQRVDRVELVVQRPREHVTDAGVDAEGDAERSGRATRTRR